MNIEWHVDWSIWIVAVFWFVVGYTMGRADGRHAERERWWRTGSDS